MHSSDDGMLFPTSISTRVFRPRLKIQSRMFSRLRSRAEGFSSTWEAMRRGAGPNEWRSSELVPYRTSDCGLLHCRTEAETGFECAILKHQYSVPSSYVRVGSVSFSPGKHSITCALLVPRNKKYYESNNVN